MSRLMSLTFLIALVVTTTPQRMHAAPPRDPAAIKQTYGEISEQLEQGGSLFIVANMEGFLEAQITSLVNLASLAPAPDNSDEEKLLRTIANLSGFLERSGFYAINGIGVSVLPRKDGMNSVHMFASRDHEAATLPLWRGLIGEQPLHMTCHSYLPADTVLARSGTGKVASLWTLFQNAVKDMGGAEAEASFQVGMQATSAQLGTTIDSLFNSLGSQGVFSLQLSSSETIPLPTGATEINIPQPSALIVVEVKDDAILDTIKTMFATQFQMPIPETRVGDGTVYTLPIPIPSPIPVQITLAKHGRYLLIGSTSSVITDALEAAAKGTGLCRQPEFTAAFAGQPKKNNGILFISKRLGKVIVDIQGVALEQMATQAGDARPAIGFIQKQFLDRFNTTTAFTIQNLPTGIQVSGTSAAGGQALVSGLSIAPIGLLSAIAIPSFVKARTTSQENACINNLRQLDAAKEQWAMAEAKRDGDSPDEPGVLEYIKGATMPVCPRGGTYTLNPIGTEPTCSNPGHQLR